MHDLEVSGAVRHTHTHTHTHIYMSLGGKGLRKRYFSYKTLQKFRTFSSSMATGDSCVLCRQRCWGLDVLQINDVIKNFRRKCTVKDAFRKWNGVLNSHRNLAPK
jgi:hypothetical protein